MPCPGFPVKPTTDEIAITRPHRRRIMRDTAARVEAECGGQIYGYHLVPILVAQLHEQVIPVDASIRDQNIKLLHFFFRARHQRFDRILVREIAWQHMHAAAQRSRESIESILARAGDRDSRSLCMKCACDRSTERAAGAGYQRSLSVQVEHHALLPALKAATSSGLPIAVAEAPSARRLISPLNTLPAPIS